MGIVVLQGSLPSYGVGGSDDTIAYAGPLGGREVDLPQATGSERLFKFVTSKLTTPTNALLVRPFEEDVIGGGLAGAAISLGSGSSFLLIFDVAVGLWAILDRSPNNVTTPQTGAAYVVQQTDDFVPCDTSGASVVVTLPALPLIGEGHVIFDVAGDAATNNLTVSGNQNLINGLSNLVIAAPFGSKRLDWVGGAIGWLAR